MRHFFLGQASNLTYTTHPVLKSLFAFGTEKDSNALTSFLAEHYRTLPSRVFLTSSGRAALTIALNSLHLKKHTGVIINGFSCIAVVRAVQAAGLIPVYADIDASTLNFTPATLESLIKKRSISAIIIQNTLGLPADYHEILRIAKSHDIRVIEDLAHCTGLRYPSGSEMGTIADATCLSFGKGKSLDTSTGGACILSAELFSEDHLSEKLLSLPDRPLARQSLPTTLRARWYPFFACLGHFFTRLGLSRYYYGLLIRLHFISRSADLSLDTHTRPAHWQSRLALIQMKHLLSSPSSPRTPYLVSDRAACLAELERSGYHFSEIWYDTPISPARYYHDLHFPEEDCPTSVFVSQHIINLPTYYSKSSLKPALDIIKKYEKGVKIGKK